MQRMWQIATCGLLVAGRECITCAEKPSWHLPLWATNLRSRELGDWELWPQILSSKGLSSIPSKFICAMNNFMSWGTEPDGECKIDPHYLNSSGLLLSNSASLSIMKIKLYPGFRFTEKREGNHRVISFYRGQYQQFLSESGS